MICWFADIKELTADISAVCPMTTGGSHVDMWGEKHNGTSILVFILEAI